MTERDQKPATPPKGKEAKVEPEADLDLDLDLDLDEIEPNQRLKEGFTGQER